MRFMSARSHDRNDPWIWLSEPLMAAEQAAGIPLLSRLAWHQITQPSHTPRHRSQLAREARHPPSSRKNHDGSIAPISNSIKSSAILCDSALGKTAKRKGNIVLQSHFRLAPLPSGSLPNIPTGHSGKTLTSRLLPVSRLSGGQWRFHFSE
jgi:hypothetical protein